MEDLTKRRAHSVPSNYITLQQLQERRLREQQKEREEEEERQRRLRKQREEEEEKERQRQPDKQREEEEEKTERERQHLKSIQTQRIKAPGGPDKKNCSGKVKTLSVEGEITGREGEFEESKKVKKSKRKPRGKRTADVETVNDRASNGEIAMAISVSSAEIIQKLADMKVSDHEEMGGADGLDEKSTAERRRVASRAKIVRRVTVVKGEKMAEMNGSDGRNGSFGHEKRGGYGRKGARRRPEPARQITAVESVKPDGLDGSDRADERLLAHNRGSARRRGRPGPPLRQIEAANSEATAEIDGADEADGKDGVRIEPARPSAVFDCDERGKMDGSDGGDERSAAENKSTSPSKRPLFADEKPGELYGLDGVYEGSAVKIRSFTRRGGRYTAGTRSGFGEGRFGGRPGQGQGQGQVWVRKDEIPVQPSHVSVVQQRGEAAGPEHKVYGAAVPPRRIRRMRVDECR